MVCFLCLRDNTECFFPFISLRDRQGEETYVDESGNPW